MFLFYNDQGIYAGAGAAPYLKYVKSRFDITEADWLAGPYWGFEYYLPGAVYKTYFDYV